MTTQHRSHASGWFRSPAGLALLGFLVIAGFFLLAEHRAHLFSVLPYLLLIACPLLHLLMHGRHGGHGNSGKGNLDRPETDGHGSKRDS